jgi:hypothetical protein
MVNVASGTSTSNHGDAKQLLFWKLGCVYSYPDPLADWRAVTVVGRVMVTYVDTWYLRVV